MTLSALPTASTSATEANWWLYARFAFPDGIDLTYLNKCLVYGDSSGRQVKVKTGRCIVGATMVTNDAEATVSLTTNSSGSTRYDGIFLNFDRTTDAITLTATVGTTDKLGPSPTQNSSTWQVKLAVVTLTNSYTTVAAADVRDTRPVGVDYNGNPAGNLTCLYDNTFSSDTASWDVTDIPGGGFSSLDIVIRGRSIKAAVNQDEMKMQLNNDTGSNYYIQDVNGANTTVAAGRLTAQTSAFLGQTAAATATANIFSVHRIKLVWSQNGLFNPTFECVAACIDSSGNQQVESIAGLYTSTSPVTRVKVFTLGNIMKTGSRLTIHGIA